MKLLRKGDRFKVLKSIEDLGLTLFDGPNTGSFRYRLEPGELIVCDHDQVKGGRTFFAMPVKRAAFVKRCEKDFKSQPHIGAGYALVMMVKDIGSVLEKL